MVFYVLMATKFAPVCFYTDKKLKESIDIQECIDMQMNKLSHVHEQPNLTLSFFPIAIIVCDYKKNAGGHMLTIEKAKF